MPKKKLGWCGKCKEYSTFVKIYDGVKRVEICKNKGCGRVIRYPDLKVEESNEKINDYVIIGID